MAGLRGERTYESLERDLRILAVHDGPRPADVLARIRWDGAANRWQNAVIIAAILRSWEERFGVRLLTIRFAEIQLLASRERPAGPRPHANSLRSTPGYDSSTVTSAAI